MMNIFSPFPPPPRLPDWQEMPTEAARPKCWKSLGHLFPGVEGHYGIAGYRGDMDVDREHDLRNEMLTIVTVLSNNAAFTGDMTFVKPGRDLVVRIVECDCGARALMSRN